MSLANSVPTTMLPVTDTDRAQKFYSDSLMLPYLGQSTEGTLLFGLGGGASLGLMAQPPGAQAEHTAISFDVKDIRTSIDQLQSRGVEFLDYDLPNLKTVDRICEIGSEKAAWFQDPDGNYLCLHQTMH